MDIYVDTYVHNCFLFYRQMNIYITHTLNLHKSGGGGKENRIFQVFLQRFSVLATAHNDTYVYELLS